VDDHNLPELTQTSYVKESALALWDHLPWVLLADFLFVVSSLPALLVYLFGFTLPGILLGIVTAGPAAVAMVALITRALLREPISALDFFRAFKQFFMRGVGLGLIIALPLTAANLTLPLLQYPPVPAVVWAGLGADVAGLVFLGAMLLYIYPQIVIYDLGIRTAYKNSLILASSYLSNTIGLLAMALLLTVIAAQVSYWLLIVFPGCWLVFVINNCRMGIKLELEKTGGMEE
jgi:uncharacterized membrane protein YesL